MFFRSVAALAATAAIAAAQRPANVSICDYYTTALLTNNTAANQYTLLTLVVNTAVIGNYTMPNVGIAVTGILNKGMYMGQEVNLLPYFDGGLASTNDINMDGTAVAVNFLDGGGAAPLLKNMPADSTSSAQYVLLTHLYSYFGALLGCTGYGSMGFPSYAGRGSQYNVHRFMDLDAAEVGYFIEQVGLSAASFGVATADVEAVGMALAGIFDVRCAPPTTVIPAQGAQLQSICVADDCPLSPNATCSSYQPEMAPLVANASLADGEGRNASSSSMISTVSTSNTMAQTFPTSSASAAASSLSASAMSSMSMTMPMGSASASGSVTPYSTSSAPLATYTGAAAKEGVAAFGAVIGGAALIALAL